MKIKKKKIMLVFGTRPEAIKMAPLVHVLKKEQNHFNVKLCVTAQHRLMLDQVLKIFDIVPDIDLDLMKSKQDLFDLTSSVLLAMKQVFSNQKPDVVLVHGDTTTSLGTAMAAFYAGVPVGHVEAGLRTYDLYAPYPEEFNRQIVSKLSKWHFAPTLLNRSNLITERVDPDTITVTGNTVIDALHWILMRINSDENRALIISDQLESLLPFNWKSDQFVLITGHRRENFGEGFLQICEALKDLAVGSPDTHFVFPVHMNPNVQKPVYSILKGLPNIHLIEPLDYEPFVYLLKHCFILLTDSGGIQEEAPSLGKPVLVMRDVTERPEAVEAGTVKLVGTVRERIVESVNILLTDKNVYNEMIIAQNPYGDGNASNLILKTLLNQI